MRNTIVQILKQIKKFATPIVVNDFSSDGTTHLLRKNGFKFYIILRIWVINIH